MATISYTCNICKRSIELVENQFGITSYGKCIITNGCKGKLISTGRNPDSNRQSFPLEVAGLEDYIPRRALYNFSQYNLSTVWNINHQLNTNVAVSVFEFNSDGSISSSEYNRNLYNINIIDSNNVQLIFNSKISGVAQIEARTSRSPSIILDSPTTPQFQVTTNGYFTFAIPKFLTKFTYPPTIIPVPSMPYNLINAPIRFGITVIKPDQETIECFENIDGSLNLTPWIAWNEILIRKRKNFYPISKYILNFQSFYQQNLTFSSIPQGTQLFFNSVDYGTGVFQPIENEDVYILLSNSPFTPTDKIRNNIINISELFKNNVPLVYNNSDFYIDSAYIEQTYPNIIKV